MRVSRAFCATYIRKAHGFAQGCAIVFRRSIFLQREGCQNVEQGVLGIIWSRAIRKYRNRRTLHPLRRRENERRDTIAPLCATKAVFHSCGIPVSRRPFFLCRYSTFPSYPRSRRPLWMTPYTLHNSGEAVKDTKTPTRPSNAALRRFLVAASVLSALFRYAHVHRTPSGGSGGGQAHCFPTGRVRSLVVVLIARACLWIVDSRNGLRNGRVPFVLYAVVVMLVKIIK